ncbi:MAG: TonB-dependent receptor plug domain-containing protein, partial [Salibacteraceae bacterium]|nr:TonB-dependent receptor plug domain-containing protein [Salibacteraceae bacterium]
MKQLMLSVFMAVILLAAQGQVVTVKDAESDQTIPLVTLFSETQNLSVITDARGQADISAFAEALDIEFRSIGYKTKTVSYSQLQNQAFTIGLSQNSISLNQVVVSASKWSQTSREVPSKIKVISAKDIALQNPQTAADLLASSGEVYIQKSQQGGGSPMIRGFSTNRLLLTVDGVRMNTAIFRSGNVQNVISIDPFATESAEVLFGPGSVIYGSDAIGGVMSFNTLTPTFSATDKVLVSGNALARYSSSNSEQTAHFDLNLGWKKWALVTSFSNFNYDDLKMGKYGPDDYLMPYNVQRVDSIDRVVQNENPLVQTPSAYSQMNMMQKVRFKPNKNWDLTYAFHYSETSAYSRYDRHLRTRNSLPRYAEWSYGPQVWMMNQFTVVNASENVLYDELTIR